MAPTVPASDAQDDEQLRIATTVIRHATGLLEEHNISPRYVTAALAGVLAATFGHCRAAESVEELLGEFDALTAVLRAACVEHFTGACQHDTSDLTH